MTGPRIHCDLPLAVGREVSLRGERHHYLAHVLRLAAGSPVNLFNHDGEFSCRVASVERRLSRVLCARAVVPLPRSRLHAALYVSVAKGRSMDLAMQKAAELGAASVQPVLAARSVAAPAAWERKLPHWRGIVRSACEQCGRADVPEVAAPMLFERLEAPRDAVAFVLDPDARRGLSAAARALPGVRVAALFGPEGGLTEDEVRMAQARGFVPASLGPRLLRVETAVTAALSVLQAFAGDFAATPDDAGA